jgi:hypothetical protein
MTRIYVILRKIMTCRNIAENRTARTGQLYLDSQSRTARKAQSGQESQDREAWTGQP